MTIQLLNGQTFWTNDFTRLPNGDIRAEAKSVIHLMPQADGKTALIKVSEMMGKPTSMTIPHSAIAIEYKEADATMIAQCQSVISGIVMPTAEEAKRFGL